jgi:hypothetical protein
VKSPALARSSTVLRSALRSPTGRALLHVASRVARVVGVAALPFWVLVRGSVYAHQAFSLNAWLALCVGALLAILALALPMGWLWHRLTGHHRIREIVSRVVLPLTLGFCLYSLVSVAASNTKTTEVRAFYTDLHPILRVSISTLVLIDGDLVITDIARSPADYSHMGLPIRSSSLHYAQADGWVHAVDLRTRGRSELRNALVRFYVFCMGLQSRRHEGTADHLHVSL